ncbi:MAG: outer membrane protein assembly factor BamA [Planctomycetota bacterium]|nr:MAG: outer membrane protein assembly factor BamA [Planctomycetota bacterium]
MRTLLLVAAVSLLVLAAPGCRSAPVAGAPAARRVETRWRGVHAFPKSRLVKQIDELLAELRTERERERAIADDAAFAVEGYYRSQGFAHARVVWQIVHSDAQRVRLRFIVAEGPRVRIGSIRFEGNHVFDDEQLAALVDGPRAGLLGTGARYFVEDEARAAARKIANAYRLLGYYRVEVRGPQLRWSWDRSRVDLRYEIVEGTRFHVADVELLGTLPLPANKLARTYADQLHQPYTPRRVFRIRNAVREALRDAGYPDAQVQALEQFDEQRGQVHVLLLLEPGPQVHVSRIRITGNRRTRRWLVRNRLTLQPGALWTASAERESERRLLRTGLFRRATLSLEPEADDPQRAVLHVQLEETPAIEFYVEPGYGSYELARIRLGLRHRNVLGTGRQVYLEGKAAVRAAYVAGGLTDPLLFGDDTVGDLSGYWKRREEPSYTIVERGAAVTLSHRWTGSLFTQLAWRFARTRLHSVEIAEDEIPASDAQLDTSAFEIAPSWDVRDNPLLPSRGAVLRLSGEWGGEAIGSGFDYVRLRARAAAYLPLTPFTVLALGGSAGLIFPTGGDEVPLQQRFFNGGENTVRSFRQDRLGPTDARGKPVGGEGMWVASAELRQRLWRKFGFALFYDAGRVSVLAEDLFERKDVRHAVGAGLRYALPVGPLRLDLGVNPKPRRDEERWALHFSVGLAY